MSVPRRLVRSGLVILSFVGISACGNADTSTSLDPTPSAAQDLLRSPELEAAQQEAIDSFEGTFPSGYTRPDFAVLNDRLLSATDGPIAFADGFAEGHVVNAWRCAWQAELLEAVEDGDASAMQVAYDELGTFYDFTWSREHLQDPERAWFTTVVDPAMAADTFELEREVAMCRDGMLP